MKLIRRFLSALSATPFPGSGTIGNPPPYPPRRPRAPVTHHPNGAIEIEVGERHTSGFWECCCGCTECVVSGPHQDHGHEGPPVWVEPGAPDWPWPESRQVSA